MAKIGQFKIDSHAQQTGEWVSPGEEFDDLEILTRGLTDEYTDMRATRMRRAAQAFGGDTSRVPNAVQRAIVIDCLLRHVLLGVRNLVDDAGNAIDLAGFQALLRDPDYGELVLACITAAGKVGKAKAADVEDAAGNSAPLSA